MVLLFGVKISKYSVVIFFDEPMIFTGRLFSFTEYVDYCFLNLDAFDELNSIRFHYTQPIGIKENYEIMAEMTKPKVTKID